MAIGGYGYTRGQRINADDRMRFDRMLSERHYKWGHDCPAVDLDFLLCEFNHGVPVAIVDYKHHSATVDRVNSRTYETLSELYNKHGDRLPFFVARYWPDTWAFKVLAVNAPAETWLAATEWYDVEADWLAMTERQYVRALYALRKDALTRGDEGYISRLNNTPPPRESEAA